MQVRGSPKVSNSTTVLMMMMMMMMMMKKCVTWSIRCVFLRRCFDFLDLLLQEWQTHSLER